MRQIAGVPHLIVGEPSTPRFIAGREQKLRLTFNLMFDMRSVIATGVLTNIICTLVVLVLWLQNRKRYNGLLFWFADYALQTAGLLLIVLRGILPDWMSIVCANVFVLVGALLGLYGLELFTGIRQRRSHNIVLVAVFVLVHIYLTYCQPNLPARSANIAAALLLICGQCVWLTLKQTHTSIRQATRLVGVVFIGYCLLFMGRLLSLASVRDTTTEYLKAGTPETLFLMLTQMLFILLTYALVLMVNKRLILAIQVQEEKYSKAFHSSQYGLLLTRLSDGMISEFNEGLQRTMGFSHQELAGKTTAEINLWATASDRASIIDCVLAHGRVSDREVVLLKKTGEQISCLFSAEVIVINGERHMLSTINDITEQKKASEERERLISEREKALSEVKVMSGLLPICAACKKIRDGEGQWHQMESYVRSHSQAEFSHGLCPDCERTLYPEYS